MTARPVTRVSDALFVGRLTELARLGASLEGAARGQGAVIAVIGEPGIGKSRLVSQFAVQAQEAGTLVLSGRCYEDDWSPPYIAFIEAIESYLREPGHSLADGVAIELSRIVPSLVEHAGPVAEDNRPPEERKYRLFQAVVSLLRNAASGRPVCLVLEDVHDADAGTLDLLTHLGRHVPGSRLLVVCTFREQEAQSRDAIARVLAEIDRAAPLLRIVLTGLTAEEVGELVAGEAQREAGPALAGRVWSRTGGNPLFVREIARSLGAPGDNPEKVERTIGGIPAGVRDALAARLARLSSPCRSLLATAAVIGADADAGLLRHALVLDEATYDLALGEAVAAGVVSEIAETSRYAFAHGLFREAIYRELPLHRRSGLHVKIGLLIEEHGIPGSAAALAEHFSHATDPAELAKAVSYGEVAAQRAAAVYAHDEAAVLLQGAIAVQLRLDPEDRERLCALRISLCEALVHARHTHPDHTTMVASTGHDEDAVQDCPLLVAADAAYLDALDVADQARAARACELALLDCMLGRSASAFGSATGRLWVSRGEAAIAQQSRARVFVEIAVSSTLPAAGDEARSHLERAMRLAADLGDHEALHIAAMAALAYTRTASTGSAHDMALPLDLLDRVWATPRDTVAPAYAALGLMACVGDGLWHGSRDRLDAAIGQADAIVARSGSPAAEVRARVFRWTQMALDGRFEALLAEIPGRNDEDARHLEILYMAWYRPALYLGRTEALQLAVEVAGAAQPALATHLLTFTGGDDLARERVRSAVRAGRAWSPGHVLLLEAANRLGEREAAAMRLEQADRAGAVTTGFECATIIDRHRGDALALLGHVEDAREAYASAIGVAERMRWRPEIALIRLSQARLLLEHEPTSRPDALAHLEFAAKEFEAMGMLPYLQDAASLAEQLRGTTRHPAGLSEREVEVLRLLAEGRSNAGIAAELVIAQATVARHASNILNKTGLSNRTQAAAFAVAHGLAIAGPAEQRP